MSTNANVSAMQEVQKKRSEQKLQTLQIVLEDLLANGESITMKRVTEISGLSRQYIYSNKEANVLFNNAKIKSESISPIPKNDLIMQHEELRRKLQDSYILQHQLLSAENEISEIEAKLAIARSEHDKKIAYQKASPKFKLHVVPVDMPEDELITYQLKTSTGSKDAIIKMKNAQIASLSKALAIAEKDLGYKEKYLNALEEIKTLKKRIEDMLSEGW